MAEDSLLKSTQKMKNNKLAIIALAMAVSGCTDNFRMGENDLELPPGDTTEEPEKTPPEN